VTGFSGSGHEHSRFSLAEIITFSRGFVLHGIVPVMSVPAVGHNICSAVFSLCCITVYDFSVSSESEHGTGRNINIYSNLLHRFQVTRVPGAEG